MKPMAAPSTSNPADAQKELMSVFYQSQRRGYLREPACDTDLCSWSVFELRLPLSHVGPGTSPAGLDRPG